MTPEEFEVELKQLGFAPPVPVTREPNGHLDEHTHPFEARALIQRGEITLQVAGQPRTYRAGEVFHLSANTPHVETYGPEGVSYLAGRR
jgi:hypothetical protein